MTGSNDTDGAGTDPALEGVWLAVDAAISGHAAPDVTGRLMTFSGNRFQITRDGETVFGGTYTCDPEANPPTIELEQNESRLLAGVWLGIYEARGDKLTICDNAPDMTKPCPKAFGDGNRDGYIVVYFQRTS